MHLYQSHCEDQNQLTHLHHGHKARPHMLHHDIFGLKLDFWSKKKFEILSDSVGHTKSLLTESLISRLVKLLIVEIIGFFSKQPKGLAYHKDWRLEKTAQSWKVRQKPNRVPKSQ